MKTHKLKIAISALCIAVPSFLMAAQQLATVKVAGVTGDVTLIEDSTGKVIQLTEGATFTEGYTIKTADKSHATILFSTGSHVAITSNTTVTIADFNQEAFDPSLGSFETLQADPSPSKIELALVEGDIIGRTKKIHPESDFVISTPTEAAFEITGTEWRVEFSTSDGGATHTMTVSNFDGSTTLFWTQDIGAQYASVSSGSQIQLIWTGAGTVTMNIDNISASDAQAIYAFLLQDVQFATGVIAPIPQARPNDLDIISVANPF